MNLLRTFKPAGLLSHARRGRAKARGRAVCCDGQASSASAPSGSGGNWELARFLVPACVGGFVGVWAQTCAFDKQKAHTAVLVQLAIHSEQLRQLDDNMKTRLTRLETRLDSCVAELRSSMLELGKGK